MNLLFTVFIAFHLESGSGSGSGSVATCTLRLKDCYTIRFVPLKTFYLTSLNNKPNWAALFDNWDAVALETVRLV